MYHIIVLIVLIMYHIMVCAWCVWCGAWCACVVRAVCVRVVCVWCVRGVRVVCAWCATYHIVVVRELCISSDHLLVVCAWCACGVCVW